MINEDLTKTPVLAYYSSQQPLTLSVDESPYGLGAVLLQEGSDGQRRPVAYASQALSETEQRYAQVEKEALGVTWGCERFRMYILGLRFHVETDHKPLIPLFSTKRTDELTPRLQRLRLRVVEYDFSISHVLGKELCTADVLSRNPLSSACNADVPLQAAIEEYEAPSIEVIPSSPGTLSRLRRAVLSDTSTSEVAVYCRAQWPANGELPPELRKYASAAAKLSVVDGLSQRGTWLVVPPVLSEEILERIHTGPRRGHQRYADVW